MKEYLIWREGDDPDPVGDANRANSFKASEFGANFALHNFLWFGEENSWFVDGYPKGDAYCVLNIETGEVYRFLVDTEFEPNFLVGEIR